MSITSAKKSKCMRASGTEKLLLFQEFQKMPGSQDADLFVFAKIMKVSISIDDRAVASFFTAQLDFFHTSIFYQP